MYVCVYIYVCMYVRTYLYMYLFMCMYVRMYVCMYFYAFWCILCMYVCKYVCMCVYVCYLCMYVCMYVRTYVCIYVCIYVWETSCLSVWLCMYVYVNICMHACLHSTCMYVCIHVCMYVSHAIFDSWVIPLHVRTFVFVQWPAVLPYSIECFRLMMNPSICIRTVFIYTGLLAPCLHVYLCMYTCTHSRYSTCLPDFNGIWRKYTHAHIHTQTHTHTRTHARTRTHAHTSRQGLCVSVFKRGGVLQMLRHTPKIRIDSSCSRYLHHIILSPTAISRLTRVKYIKSASVNKIALSATRSPALTRRDQNSCE